MAKEPSPIRFKQAIIKYRGVVLTVFAMLCLFLVGIIIYKQFNPFTLPDVERRTLFALIPLGLLALALWFPYSWAASRMKSWRMRWVPSALQAIFGWAKSKGLIPLTRGQVLLLIFLVSAFLIRLYYAAVSNVDLDEGQFIYDAHLLGDGLIPFVDWTTRAPLLLGFLAASIKVFGYTLMAGKLVSIFFTILTGYLLYRVGKELYSKRVGLIACVLYLFMPFVIYWTIITKEEPVQAFFIVLSMYMLLLGLKSGQNKFFFLNGLFIAAAFLIRRSSLIYLPFEPLVLLLFYRQLGVVLKKESLILAGALVGVLPLFYLPLLTDWRWANFVYGWGGTALLQQTSAIDVGKVAFNTLVLTMPLVLLPLSFIIVGIKKRWAYLAVKPGLPLIIGLGLLFASFLAFSLLQYGDRWNMIPLSTEAKIISGILFTLGLVSIYSLISRGNLPKVKAGFSHQLLFYWLGSICLFYIIFVRAWFGNYFLELVPPLCIMSAVILSSVYTGFSNGRRASQAAFFRLSSPMLIVFLTGSVLFSGVIFSTAYQYSRSWSMHDVNEVAEYISQRTSEGEEIFTAGTAFAVAANRPVVLNISHQALYQGVEENPVSYDPYGVIPKVSEIVSYLQEHNVRYIIMDGRTKGMVDTHPALREFVYSNYILEAKFHKADVYKRITD